MNPMPAKLIRSLYNITPEDQGGVVTIGNFDGVHLGHQALLRETVKRARELGVPSVVMTFEPHPFEFFGKGNAPIARLTRLREKFREIEKCGIDRVIIITFNQSVASLSASDFVRIYLAESLRPQHVVVGDDFHFGCQRQGNFDLLTELGKGYGFTVSAMHTLMLGGERVSSTRVRQVLHAGDHQQAGELLGRPYSMLGRVRGGNQLGRQWGFPTANIFLHRAKTPVMGIFTVLVHGVADHPWPGAANLGVRPTVDGTRTLLEVHLLDFNEQIYGRYVEVEFCEKLRDEIRYPTIEELKEQIAKDVAVSRTYFQKKGLL
jgi:riboflavin kinase/FMN adenylyltransferase